MHSTRSLLFLLLTFFSAFNARGQATMIFSHPASLTYTLELSNGDLLSSISGDQTEGAAMLRSTANGQFIWWMNVSGGWDAANNMTRPVQRPDGSLVFAASIKDGDERWVHLIATNSDGTIQWARKYPPLLMAEIDIALTISGNIAMICRYGPDQTNIGSPRVLLVVDGSGEPVSCTAIDNLYPMMVASSGESFVITGLGSWLARMDANGNTEWCVGSPGSTASGCSIAVLPSGTILQLEETYSFPANADAIAVRKFDPLGAGLQSLGVFPWGTTSSAENDDHRSSSMAISPDGSTHILVSNHPSFYCSMIEVDSDLVLVSGQQLPGGTFSGGVAGASDGRAIATTFPSLGGSGVFVLPSGTPTTTCTDPGIVPAFQGGPFTLPALPMNVAPFDVTSIDTLVVASTIGSGLQLECSALTTPDPVAAPQTPPYFDKNCECLRFPTTTESDVIIQDLLGRRLGSDRIRNRAVQLDRSIAQTGLVIVHVFSGTAHTAWRVWIEGVH